MSLSLNRWRPSHLLGVWVAYWAGLAAVSMRDVIAAGFNATQAGGSISGGLSSSDLGITVVQKAGETLKWAAPVSEVSAWVAIPPLLLWAAWLMSRKRAARHTPPELLAGSPRERRHDVAAPMTHDMDTPRTPVP